MLTQLECIQVSAMPNIQVWHPNLNARIGIMELHDRLKIARESTGRSLEDMAKALDVGHRSWCGYEAGSNYPGGRVFESLARMGFNTNWLLTGEGEMLREDVYPLAETLKNGDLTSDNAKTVVMVAPAASPGVEPVKVEDKPFGWFHEWIDEELQGKSISEIMSVAVELKAILSKKREG